MKRWNHQAEEKPSRRFIAALTLAMVLILPAAGTSLAAVTVDVPPIPANVLEIDPVSPRTAAAAEPEILVWSGEISRDGQVDSYQVTLDLYDVGIAVNSPRLSRQHFLLR